MDDAQRAGKKFQKLVQILDILRGDEGCPWDREQDERSILNYFLEEVYEAVEALNQGQPQSLAEELGDVLMEVVFLSRLYKEKEKFTIVDVLAGINQKMIRRHPHVFGKKRLRSSQKVRCMWERQKREEKKKQSLFEDRIKSSPSLLEAFQIGQQASVYDFDWDQPSDALQKLKEEVAELEEALAEKEEKEIFQEIGDIFFSLANVSRLLGINPEVALKSANLKFLKRFQTLEKTLREKGREIGQVSSEELDEIWEQTKQKIK